MKKSISKMFLGEINKNKKKNYEVLDSGCGCGTDIFVLNVLARNKNINFTGLDFSVGGIKQAKLLAKEKKVRNCKFIVGDAEKIKLKKKFDLLLSSEVLEHTTNPSNYLKSSNQTVKLGGKIILTTPNGMHVFKRIFKILPNKFRKKVKKEQDWCIERHGRDPKEEFDSHISTQDFDVLKELLKKNGFKIKKVIRSPLIYGGNWIDKRPFLLSFLIFLDGVLPRSFVNFGWDIILMAEKVREV